MSQKFAVVYHTDNFNVRVHKMIANLYVLLAYACKIDPRESRTMGEKLFREKVHETLRLPEHGLADLARKVLTFQKDEEVMKAVDARNLFVHRYRDESGWSVLDPRERYREPEDELAKMVSGILQTTDLDIYAKRKAREFIRVLEKIQTLRDDIWQIVLKRYDNLVASTRVKRNRR